MADLNTEKKNSQLRSKDKALIKLALGIVIGLGGYLVGTSVLSPKIDEVNKVNAGLQEQVNELQNASARKSELTKELEKMQTAQKDILSRFPENYTIEQALNTIENDLMVKFGCAVTEVQYTDNGDFYTFVGEDGVENATLGKIASANVRVAFGVPSYAKFKEIVKYINEMIPTKATIKEIEISALDDPGFNQDGLQGEASFVVYFGANIREYVEPEFKVDVGRTNKNLFYEDK